MRSANSDDRIRSLSLLTGSFNFASWLPMTLGPLSSALTRSSWNAEVVVTDDGARDNTAIVLSKLAIDFPMPLRIVGHENRGRFLAPREGSQAARFDKLLLLDSRDLSDERALNYLHQATASEPTTTHLPRTSIGKVLAHSWDRGSLCVDSYAGTSSFRNGVHHARAVAPPLALVARIAFSIASLWPVIVTLVGLVVARQATSTVIASPHQCPL